MGSPGSKGNFFGVVSQPVHMSQAQMFEDINTTRQACLCCAISLGLGHDVRSCAVQYVFACPSFLLAGSCVSSFDRVQG